MSKILSCGCEHGKTTHCIVEWLESELAKEESRHCLCGRGDECHHYERRNVLFEVLDRIKNGPPPPLSPNDYRRSIGIYISGIYE